MTFNEGDTVRVQRGVHAGEIHTVESVKGAYAWITLGENKYLSPYPTEHLKKIDVGTFKVGDRVTGKENSLKGQKAPVVGMDRDWVKVRSDSRPGDVRRYRPSELVHLDVMESDLSFVDVEGVDTNAKTVIRVVAIFSSLGTQKLEMVFYDARKADVWIDYLKTAPGRMTVTVTRNTTETFTRNNA